MIRHKVGWTSPQADPAVLELGLGIGCHIGGNQFRKSWGQCAYEIVEVLGGIAPPDEVKKALRSRSFSRSILGLPMNVALPYVETRMDSRRLSE